MTLHLAITALAIIATWAPPVAIWRLRTWRGCGLALAASVAILSAGALPFALSPWLQAVILGGVIAIFLTQGGRFGVMPATSYTFVEAYIRALHQIRRLQPLEMEPASFLAQFESAIRGLESLSAPDDDWVDLQQDTIRELRHRLELMRTVKRRTNDEQRASQQRWEALEQRFRNLLNAKAGFWTGWPRISWPR